jgi:hypothetical protein
MERQQYREKTGTKRTVQASKPTSNKQEAQAASKARPKHGARQSGCTPRKETGKRRAIV